MPSGPCRERARLCNKIFLNHGDSLSCSFKCWLLLFLILLSVLGVSFTAGPNPHDFYIFLGLTPDFSLSWLCYYLLTSPKWNSVISPFSMIIPKLLINQCSKNLVISHTDPWILIFFTKFYQNLFLTILLDMYAYPSDLTNIYSFAYIVIFPNFHHVTLPFSFLLFLCSSAHSISCCCVHIR